MLLEGKPDAWTLGEALLLRNDLREWRIIEMTEDRMRVLYDDRRAPVFRWIHNSQARFNNRAAIWWKVFSIHGVAQAVRHTAFAPGDLYLDDRDETPGVIRQLSPQEKWNVTGLSDAKATWLTQAGQADSLGPLAGNSIPVGMAALVAEQAAARVQKFVELTAAREAGSWVTMQCMPKLGCTGASAVKMAAVLLVILDLNRNSVAVNASGDIPIMVGEFDQKQAYSTATSWAAELGLQGASSTSLLMEQSRGGSTVFSVIYFAEHEREQLKEVGLEHVSAGALVEPDWMKLVAEALVQVLKHRSAVRTTGEAQAWGTGRVDAHAAWEPEAEQKSCSSEQAAFFAQVREHEARKADLEALLHADGSVDMLEWKSRLGTEELESIPQSLQKPVAVETASGLLITDPHVPIDTEWQPLPDRSPLQPRPAPQGWLSAVRPMFRKAAADVVDAFRGNMSRWLAGESDRPEAVVIPGLWLEHWVFEGPHEFVSRPGWATPIDLSTPSESHLNLDFLAEQGIGHPDQELISFLILGVRYKADLPTQIVLQPHLKSFLRVQDKFLLEAGKFVERGWTIVSDSLPMVPYFLTACGSVCRKLEPERPRTIFDAGAPRVPLWDSDGIRVLPLNEAIAGSAWPKESKPRALHVVCAIAILQEAAAILGETIFVVTDDFKSFFNQLRLAPSEYCKTGVLHPPRPGQARARFAYDTVLGFGVKMASNIAQRFADLIAQIFRRKLAPVVAAIAHKLCQQSSEFAGWWEHRKALGTEQAFLTAFFMYTDDPIILCLGPVMTYEALKCWSWVCRSSGAMMAIPEKRTLGTSALWIGIQFFASLGLAVVPAQKVLRAVLSVDEAISAPVTVGDYRSLLGFLQHVRDILFLRGDKMYGLYRPFDGAVSSASRLTLGELQVGRLKWLRDRIVHQPGSSVAGAPAFVVGLPMQKPAVNLHGWTVAIFSDAAKEGTQDPGLGGWICGMYWRVPLTPRLLLLDIPVLEAIAAVVNIIVAHRLLSSDQGLPASLCVEMHVDAQATAHVLIKGSARSPNMQIVHTWALQQPRFVAMLPGLVVKHIFGLGNVASDAVSRGYWHVVKAVSAALQIRARALPAPAEALEVMELVLRRQLAVQDLRPGCGGHRGERVGEASRPGPGVVFRPTQRSKIRKQFKPVQRKGAGQPRAKTAVKPPGARARLKQISDPRLLARALASDRSSQAICRGDFNKLLLSCEIAMDAVDSAFSLRTAKQDISHWTAWQAYCKSMNTSPLRNPVDPVLDREGFMREIVLLINALTYFIRTKTAKAKKDRQAGFTIQPQSAMNVLLGVNRLLKRNFHSFVPLKGVNMAVKGLMRKFLHKFGPTSLIPKRREPFTNALIQAMLRVPSGIRLGRFGILTWSSRAGCSLRAAFTLAVSTGFRKAELFQSDEETSFLSWGLVA